MVMMSLFGGSCLRKGRAASCECCRFFNCSISILGTIAIGTWTLGLSKNLQLAPLQLDVCWLCKASKSRYDKLLRWVCPCVSCLQASLSSIRFGRMPSLRCCSFTTPSFPAIQEHVAWKHSIKFQRVGNIITWRRLRHVHQHSLDVV